MKIFIHNLKIDFSIGIYPKEKTKKQPVFINVEMNMEKDTNIKSIENTICYKTISDNIKKLAEKQHFNLVEELAEEICSICLKDRRIGSVSVKIEKTEAIENADGAGIILERKQH